MCYATVKLYFIAVVFIQIVKQKLHWLHNNDNGNDNDVDELVYCWARRLNTGRPIDWATDAPDCITLDSIDLRQ